MFENLFSIEKILEKLYIKINGKKVNQKEVTASPVVMGNSNTVNNVQVTTHVGLSYQDVTTIVKNEIERNMPKLLEVAREEYRQNGNLFLEKLLESSENLTAEEFNKFGTADVQILLSSVVPQISRTQNLEKSEFLAKLIINRLSTDNNLGDYILDEAILIAPKLTSNLVNMLTLVLLISYPIKFDSNEKIKNFLDDIVNDYGTLDFSSLNTGMLVAFNCATYEPSSTGIFEYMYRNNKDLFAVHPNQSKSWFSDEQKEELIKHFKFSEATTRFIRSIYSSEVKSLYLLPIGKAIGYANMEQKNIIDWDWRKVIGYS